MAELNNDGNPDLLVRNNGNTFTAWLGGGDGSFTPVFTGTTPFGRLVTADLNGDGNIDFLTGNAGAATASIWYGNGDGTFRQATPITYNTTPPTYIQGIGVGDMNGDGTTDVVLATTEGGGAPGLRVLLNKGNGTFLPDRVTIISGVAGGAHQVLVADFDGDGKLDVADSQNQDNGGTGGTAVLVYTGNGDGTFNFRSTTNPLGDVRTQVLVAGDFDGNGETDLARLVDPGGGGTATVTVLLNTGDGNFQRPPPVIELPGGQPWGLAAGDFDRDGKSDLVTGYTTIIGGQYKDSYLEILRPGGATAPFRPS